VIGSLNRESSTTLPTFRSGSRSPISPSCGLALDFRQFFTWLKEANMLAFVMALSPDPHHFLLVENDPQEADILANAFAAIPDCGTVSIARNLSEAKAYLGGAGMYSDRQRFRLPTTILSSYHLDGDSGVDLLSWVKADANLRGIPFVLLVPSSASSTEISEAKTSSSVRVAKKPGNSKDLKGMLERLAEAMCTDSSEACHTDF
jgi:CheY-like chemotaxis protein